MTKQMKLPLMWEYDVDSGNLLCRCPQCEGRMNIYIWTYKNPYKYCPYCGTALLEGTEEFKRRYKQAYGRDREYWG